MWTPYVDRKKVNLKVVKHNKKVRINKISQFMYNSNILLKL